MSLVETQQIMAMLQEIMQILDNVNVKTVKLESNLPKTKEALNTFVQAERLALRYLAVARRMGLPDNIQQATQIITSLVVMLRMLQMSASLISGGGIGSLIGIAGVIGVVLTANDMMGYDAMRGNY
jgi:hypothetical protein